MRSTQFTIVLFLLLLGNSHAQSTGKYVTNDLKKEIVILDSNLIIISEEMDNLEIVEIRGTYTRKLGKLIVSLDSISDENEIVYQIRGVTGQKFKIKKMGSISEFETYYLRSTLNIGIN